MGCASSKTGITSTLGNNGDDKAYHDRYLEDRVLGQGEFGQVKLVHDMQCRNNPDAEPLACKVLKKGFTFKDNTIYAPLKPEVLQRECKILQTLAGKRYNLKLEALYESGSTVYVITEYCSGGEMMEYVTNAYPDGIRTEDASRIAYQLLSAVDHCAKHNVIHRDIKPENIMFKTAERGAELRLIDYGSGTMDDDQSLTNAPDKTTATTRTADGADLLTHTTFAGSAFYISPELFQRTYTQRTDVWSAGVTLYVLVAGYPADVLQKAFNQLQKSKNRDLHQLPNMPEVMPDSYFEMLDQMLTYRHKQRKSAADILDCEFVRFHKEMEEGDGNDDEADEVDEVGLSLADVAAAAAAGGGKGSTRNSSTRTKSVLIEGSVSRHVAYLEDGNFERALTTLLATVLDLDDLKSVIAAMDQQLAKEPNASSHGSTNGVDESGHSLATSNGTNGAVDNSAHDIQHLPISNRTKLQVMKVEDVHKLLIEKNFKDVADMVQDLPNYSSYKSFAYHVALLRLFTRGKKSSSSSVRRSSARRANSVFVRGDDSVDGSVHSTLSNSFGAPNSVHGGNVWQSIKRNKPITRSLSGDALNRSAHN